MELKDLGLQRINLDLSNNITENFFAKEGDIGTRGLSIKVLNNSVEIDTTGVSITMYARVGQEVYSVDATVKDALKGEYELIYPTSILKSGIVYAELQLKKLNDIISTKKFKILVESGIVTDSAIEGHDSYPIFEQLLEAGANEITRKSNEDTRKLNEIAREDAENLRGVRLTEVENDLASHKEDYANQINLKLTNLVINGDFNIPSAFDINGDSNISNGKLILGSTNFNGVNQVVGIQSVGNLMYFAIKIIENTLNNNILINYTGISTSMMTANITLNSTGVLGLCSAIAPVRNVANPSRVSVNTPQNFTGTAVVDDFIAINLTTTFGTGNEPTKEEMDKLITLLGGWFNGEITPTQKQLTNWYLKMIRENRNAIISLGGTII